MYRNWNKLGGSNFRRRGSLLILVVVALALMAILGAAFLQMARMDRIATEQLRSPTIDSVAKSAVESIALSLYNDIVDINGGGEYQDYPYTNSDPSTQHTVTKFDGTNHSSQAVGGNNDDMWLASSQPDFTGTDPIWPHLTNLNGIFLRLPKKGDNTAATFPEEYAVTNDTTGGDIREWDTGVVITSVSAYSLNSTGNTETNWENLGADADGDGILDSRWTWAPIRSSDGIAYVMAVRIVDNASMINLNVATALTSDGDADFAGATASDIPRGYFPTNIDLTRLLKRVGSAWSTELVTESTGAGSLFSFRNLSIAAPASSPPPIYPTPFGTLTFGSDPLGSPTGKDSRLSHWYNVTRLFGRPDLQFPLDEEFELRFGNGVNSSGFTSPIIEALLPTLLRASGTSERNWSDVAPSMQDYFEGTPPTDPLADRTFPEARHFLTTRSAAAIYAPNPGGLIHASTTPYPLQYDLTFNHYSGGSYATQRLTDLFDRIYAVLGIGVTDGEAYLSQDATTISQIATELAIAIQDYSDSDSVPSAMTDGTRTYYGMELLPFLREVYIQIGYEDDDLVDTGGGALPGTKDDYDTWVAVNGSQAMAIEIGNPFDRPIPPSLLNGRIQIAIVQGGTDVATYNLTGVTATLEPRSTAASPPDPDDEVEQMIIYSNPVTAVQEGGTMRSDLITSDGLSLTGNLHDASSGTLTFNTDEDITIELRVDVGSSNYVTYDRLTLAGFQLPGEITHNEQNPTSFDSDPTTDPIEGRHGQRSLARPGESIYYLSNINKAIVGSRLPANPSASDDYRNTTNANAIDYLCEDAKGSPAITGDPNLVNYQIPIADRPILSVAELGWIQMFGFTNEATGDFPQRFSGAGPAAPTPMGGALTTDVERRNLDINSTAVVPAATGIPHAAMLFDQFTTLSPRNDGVDNDNDGSNDNDAEQVVQGRININTAPLIVSALAAPLPEPIADVAELMTAIAAYRDSNNGIKGIGELIFINPDTPGSNENMQKYGANGSPETGSYADLYPLPEHLQSAGGTALAYNVTDGSEESLARFQFLSQAFTTRSDVYTAYILVRGYPMEDFRRGFVESKRYIVILDRSNITAAGQKPRVLAIFER